MSPAPIANNFRIGDDFVDDVDCVAIASAAATAKNDEGDNVGGKVLLSIELV